MRSNLIFDLTAHPTGPSGKMAVVRDLPEWQSEDLIARRHELYARAAGEFRRHGFRRTTMKVLARACGLSIPALYRYFPSKRAFALFPLHAVSPELQASPPDLTFGDPCGLLFDWVDHAVQDMPNVFLALRLVVETGLSDEEQRAVEANLLAHADELGGLARRAAANMDQRAGTELAWAMMNLMIAPALSGIQPEPESVRRQLRALLRGYGVCP